MSQVDFISNLIANFEDTIQDAGFVVTEDHVSGKTYARECKDGSTDEFVVNPMDKTISHEKYNLAGTQLKFQMTTVRSAVDVNTLLRTI